MKIRKFMKKRKIVVTVFCIAALIGAACIYGTAQPEAVQAETKEKAEHIETDAGKDASEDKGKPEEKQETADKSEKEQKAEEQTKAAAAGHQKSATSPSASKSNASGSSSGDGQKKQESPAEPSQPAHAHEWEPIKEMKEVQERIAVYGDKCNTCNEDITGCVDEHILGSNCMGYDTDVFIRYDYVTVKKEVITGYKCDCGARK